MLPAQRPASLALTQVLAGRSLASVMETALQGIEQRALAQELIYGTLRSYGRLDALLKQLLHQPLTSEALRSLLLVALYQLERTRAPDFAVVDSAVDTAALIGQPRAKGLVNALLRGFLRRRAQLETAIAHDEVARYSYPQWWIDTVRREYPQQWETILNAGNAHPPMTLRVNRRHCDSAQYQSLLREAGIAADCVDTSALRLAQPVPVTALPRFEDGWVSVQDRSAQHAARLLDVADGMRVLDACAAPGGKTGHLLECAALDLLALDSDALRLQRVEQNLQRLRLTARLQAADAARLVDWWDRRAFDRILLDVPCSGSGVVKRHPDIKWLRRVADIPQFAAQQARLLDALWPTLSPRGKLLYVSCSMFGAENVQQIRRFLARHDDARRLAIAIPGDETGQVPGQILPHELHDGFFYALLEKC